MDNTITLEYYLTPEEILESVKIIPDIIIDNDIWNVSNWSLLSETIKDIVDA